MTQMQKVHWHTVHAARQGRCLVKEHLGRELSFAPLWEGLVRFARSPQDFVESLEDCRLTETVTPQGTVLSRTLRYGPFEARDRAVLLPGKGTLRIETEPGPGIPALVFEAQLREVAPGDIYFFFSYFAESEAALGETEQIRGLRRMAWTAKDRDAVQEILRGHFSQA